MGVSLAGGGIVAGVSSPAVGSVASFPTISSFPSTCSEFSFPAIGSILSFPSIFSFPATATFSFMRANCMRMAAISPRVTAIFSRKIYASSNLLIETPSFIVFIFAAFSVMNASRGSSLGVSLRFDSTFPLRRFGVFFRRLSLQKYQHFLLIRQFRLQNFPRFRHRAFRTFGSIKVLVFFLRATLGFPAFMAFTVATTLHTAFYRGNATTCRRATAPASPTGSPASPAHSRGLPAVSSPTGVSRAFRAVPGFCGIGAARTR